MVIPVVLLSAALNAAPDEPATTPAESPTIKTLKEKVAAGDRDAVGAFWKAIQAKGTPLVEAVPGDAEHSLMTFLWRGGDETHDVAVIIPGMNDKDPAGGKMERIAGTDVWYRTYKARSDLRSSYHLSPNESLVKPADRRKNYRRDPLNPRQFQDDPPLDPFSVFALPAALPDPYLDDMPQAGVPKGKVEEMTRHSAILNEERRIWVYTPPAYDRQKGPYPLLIHFDGEGYVKDFPVPVTLDNLQAKGEIPPLLAVFVHHKNRDKDLLYNAPFADFIAKELAPFMRERYAATADPSLTVTCGSSLGGLGSAFVAFRHPECVGAVLSLSGAYLNGVDEKQKGSLVRQIEASERLPVRFFLCAGRYEQPHTKANFWLRDVLQAKGYAFRFRLYAGTHTYYSRQGCFADGMSFLIGKQKNETH